MDHAAARAHDGWHAPITLVLQGEEERLVQMTEDAAGIIRVEQDRPERVSPQWTHSVRDHQPASGSTGDPQLPICTSSQGRQGTSILSTSCQERTFVGEHEVVVLDD